MKKLLSLLSVLTISGTAIPTTIAASPYQKEETIKNSDINYQQTNNLKNLNRSKRADRYGDCVKKNGIQAGVVGGAVVTSGAIIGSAIAPGVGTLVGAGFGMFINLIYTAPIAAMKGIGDCTDNLDTYLKDVILNKDLKVINDDSNNTIFNEIKKLNPNLDISKLVIVDKKNTSAKIVALASSNYKTDSHVIVKFINKRHLNRTPDLLKNWSDNYNKWINEFNRQFREDFPSFTLQQKRTWKDDKNFQIRTQFQLLLLGIGIIQNNNYIKELYERIVTLENDLNNLKIKVDQLSSSSSLPLCGTSAGIISASSSVVPVIGDVVSYISGLISASCFLANDLN